jgi:predicted DCC family thiol-disulfide oxidoreductase YuxK
MRADRHRTTMILAGSALVLVLVTAGWFFWKAEGDGIVRAAYEGRSAGFINEFFARHRAQMPARRTLEYYLDLSARVPWVLLVAGLGLEVAVLAAAYRDRTWSFFRGFLLQPDSPFNLAWLRIAVFSATLWAILNAGELLTFLGGVPAEARFPLHGMGWVLTVLPPSSALVAGLGTALVVVCVAGILGLFSRAACVLGFALSLYLFGLYNCFGATRHVYHILPLTFAVLAFSRCGDALALDGFVRAWRRADRGLTEPPAPAPAYGIPLRFVWMILGMVYAFPGLWKLLMSGKEYVIGNNIKYLFWGACQSWDDFTPMARIDRIPWAGQFLGAATIAFELGFILCIFFRRSRFVAGVVAQSFHIGTLVFMGTPFVFLQIVETCVFDWAGVMGWIGSRAFPATMVVLYDGNCGLCRRTMAGMRTLGVLGTVRFVNATDAKARVEAGITDLDEESLMRDMHVVVGGRAWRGYESYRRMLVRMPVLWPLLPLMYLPPVAAVGRRIYRRVADSRACRLPQAPSGAPDRAPGLPVGSMVVGTVILCMMTALGLLRENGWWPAACFPTFAGPLTPVLEKSARRVAMADGTEAEWEQNQVKAGMGQYVWAGHFGFLCSLAARQAKDADRLPKLIDYWASLDPLPRGAVAVRFYKDQVSSDPDVTTNRVLSRRLLYEYDTATKLGRFITVPDQNR